MDWTEIKIRVPIKDLETAGDIAQMTVPYGIYIEDYSNLEEEVEQIARINLIDQALLEKDRSHGIIHIYINPGDHPAQAVAFLRERYTAEKIAHEIICENCAEEGWRDSWKQYFHTVPVGEKLLIRPTWHETCNPQGRIVLNLDPGLAFGTGTHETTRLCLAALEKHVKSGMQVLDVGCGSGILSVAALLLGAQHVVGVDIDATAVKIASENAQKNGVEERFEVLCGDLTEKVAGKYHIVVANIVADAVIQLCASIADYMLEDAVYIASGIIDARTDDVLYALDHSRFTVLETAQDNGWYCITAQKKR